MKRFLNVAPIVYLITDGTATTDNYKEKSAQIVELIKVAVETKISLVQIREKKLSAKLVFDLTERAVKATRGSETKILVNDRADIAFCARASGVHLTSRSVSARVIKRIFPADFIVGVSAHSIAEARAAKNLGADFVTFSPVFQSPEKGEPKGLNALREVCAALRFFPVIALGGVDATNFRLALDCGATGFAAIRFLNNAENLRKLSAKLK